MSGTLTVLEIKDLLDDHLSKFQLPNDILEKYGYETCEFVQDGFKANTEFKQPFILIDFQPSPIITLSLTRYGYSEQPTVYELSVHCPSGKGTRFINEVLGYLQNHFKFNDTYINDNGLGVVIRERSITGRTSSREWTKSTLKIKTSSYIKTNR